MSDINWYVIHTYSGYENKVAKTLETIVENQHLQDLIFEVSVPTEKVVEVKDDKQKEVERKIFPGYVLVKMILTDDSWFVVRNIRGVTGFVGPASKPVPLTEKEVEKLTKEIARVNGMLGNPNFVNKAPEKKINEEKEKEEVKESIEPEPEYQDDENISTLPVMLTNLNSANYNIYHNGYVLDVIDDNNYEILINLNKFRIKEYNHDKKAGNIIKIKIEK